MVTFNHISGDLYVRELDDNNDVHRDDLYAKVVFEADPISINFMNRMGNYFRVGEDNFKQENNMVHYYPEQNEVVAELYVGNTEGMELYEEDVTLTYTNLGDDIYLRSQGDVTAYAPVYITVNKNIYAITDSMLTGGASDIKEDVFLGINVDDDKSYINVENVETGLSSLIEYDEIEAMLKNDEPNGFVKVVAPQNVMRSLTNDL